LHLIIIPKTNKLIAINLKSNDALFRSN
jgi:hypothetical protein